MYRDDDDTILDKDNVGKTGTPYQVEEHDRYNDDGEWADADGYGEVWNEGTGQYNTVNDARNTYFNSQDSVLFTLREKTRPELKAMVGTIFQTMVQLEGSVEAFFQKYFFDIQEYFPAVAYNEVARLLYEEAKIQMAAGNYTNNTDPMTQSLGDQLQRGESPTWRVTAIHQCSPMPMAVARCRSDHRWQAPTAVRHIPMYSR